MDYLKTGVVKEYMRTSGYSRMHIYAISAISWSITTLMILLGRKEMMKKYFPPL